MTRLLAFMLAPILALAAVPAQATEWPNGARAAVVLTYDDAPTSQLDHAVPALDAAGFKGTFFLSAPKPADVERWRAVAANGHELGNHTIFHPCAASSFPADPRFTSEAYTIASMLKEIEQMNVMLSALDGRTSHGMATPCGQSLAGGVDYLEALRAANLVTYVRGVNVTPADLRADVGAMDPMHIPARGFPEGVTGPQLIALAQGAVEGGGMAVYLFHGVGGDHLPVSLEAHQALIDWLKSNPDVWVTTLQGALDWAIAHPSE
jgi:peptidoglycan-N-acetylglucosamine deacetylase